jgi:hypothetical protein
MFLYVPLPLCAEGNRADGIHRIAYLAIAVVSAGKEDSIMVYSNCDEVELFNDINGQSLGKKQRNGIGTQFYVE